MVWDPSWSRPKYPVTPEMIKKIGDALGRLLDRNNGAWTGKIADILKEADLPDDYYSTAFTCLPEVKRQYRITSRKAGTVGNEYMSAIIRDSGVDEDLTGDIPKKSYVNAEDTLSQIQFIVDKIDMKSGTSDCMKALQIIKLIVGRSKVHA